MPQSPLFRSGQTVHHKLYDYRGVVVRFDLTCQADDAWYDYQTQGKDSAPTKDQPWYHVLVDKAEHTTYVAQQNLEPSDDPSPITHPQLDATFATYLKGRYYREHLN